MKSRGKEAKGPFNLRKCLKPAHDCFSRVVSWIWQITNKWCFLMRENNHGRKGIRPQRECFGRDVRPVWVAGEKRQRQLWTRKKQKTKKTKHRKATAVQIFPQPGEASFLSGKKQEVPPRPRPPLRRPVPGALLAKGGTGSRGGGLSQSWMWLLPTWFLL